MADGYVRDREGDRNGESGVDAGADDDIAAAIEADEVDVETDDPAVVHPDDVEREFDWRGWTLVGAIFVSFLVIPGIMLAYPHVGTVFGLGLRDAYLVLPLVPAFVLGLLAVWATTRP